MISLHCISTDDITSHDSFQAVLDTLQPLLPPRTFVEYFEADDEHSTPIGAASLHNITPQVITDLLIAGCKISVLDAASEEILYEFIED